MSSAIVQQRLRDNAGLIGVIALLVLLYIAGAVLTDRFTRLGNLVNVYEQTADLAFVSIGQTLVILTGGIDLSVGSLISLIACLTSGLIRGDPTFVVPIVAGLLLLAVAIGMVNALLVIVTRVHPLIVTLGMGAVLQGVTLLYTLGPIGKASPGLRTFAYGRVYGFPIGTTVALVLCLLVTFFLRFVPLGRAVFAVGDDDTAAQLLALPRRTVLFLVYGFSGFCCGLTAIFLVSRFGIGQPYTGVNYTLASITPVIVGGTLLSGGKGGVTGTLLGAYLITLLNNLLNFMDVSKHLQLVAQALIIILAVSVYVERRRLV